MTGHNETQHYYYCAATSEYRLLIDAVPMQRPPAATRADQATLGAAGTTGV